MQSSRFPWSPLVVFAVIAVSGGCLGPNPLLALQQQQAEAGGAEAEDGAELETEGSDSDNGETGGSMSMADLGPADACELSETCAPPVLPGWQGPLRVYTGAIDALPPACEGATPVLAAELFADLDEHLSSSTCGCECGALAGASCSGVTLRRFTANNCLVANQTWALTPQGCEEFPFPMTGAYYSSSVSIASGGQCSASVVEQLTPASYATRVIACGPGDGAGRCEGGGVCTGSPSPPFDGRVCIATKGDVQCPAGPYTARSTYHDGLEDTRSCASCSCTPPTDLPCTGKVQLSAEACAGLLYAALDVGTCSNSTISSVQAAKFVPNPVTGGCEPSPAQILGAAAPTEPWTFCCL
jgi:hypothetical protein